MAIFGKLNAVKEQLQDDRFKIAFEYLTKVIEEGSIENVRIQSYSIDAFENIYLDENNFALEQTYRTKIREDCFFESHQKYIDVQYVVQGEEIIEVDNIKKLNINFAYNDTLDLIKYDDTLWASSIKLRQGDVAIFFPEDAHMPCLDLNKTCQIIKTVVKVKID